jgi:YggT family protein
LGDTSFLVQLGRFLGFALNLYCWVVVARLLISWFRPNPSSPAMRALSRATDPALDLARRLFPWRLGGLDFSPVLLLVALSVLAFIAKEFLVWLGIGGPALGLLGIAAIGLVLSLRTLTWFFLLLMAARVVISLVDPSPYNPVVMIVMALTEPLLAPLRRSFPSRGRGGLDTRALVMCGLLLILYSVVLANLGPPIQGWLMRLAAESAQKGLSEPAIW